MSTKIDNTVLALLSLKQELKTYLDDNSWRDEFSIYLAGDPDILNKEIVVSVTDKSKQIGLPLITIFDQGVTNRPKEIGDEYGNDIIRAGILVQARDLVQLTTLSNVLRRKVNNLSYTIYDYRTPRRSSLGTGFIERSSLDNLSNYNSSLISERYKSLIIFELEITAQDFI